MILAPDPTLPVRWAASAWTWTLRADCFDETAFRQFYADHYDHGPGEHLQRRRALRQPLRRRDLRLTS